MSSTQFECTCDKYYIEGIEEGIHLGLQLALSLLRTNSSTLSKEQLIEALEELYAKETFDDEW